MPTPPIRPPVPDPAGDVGEQAAAPQSGRIVQEGLVERGQPADGAHAARARETCGPALGQVNAAGDPGPAGPVDEHRREPLAHLIRERGHVWEHDSLLGHGLAQRHPADSGEPQRLEEPAPQELPVIEPGNHGDHLGQHPAARGRVVDIPAAGQPFEFPALECGAALVAVGPFGPVELGSREAARVRHHLLHGDPGLSPATELGDVIGNGLCWIDAAIADQLPQARILHGLGRRHDDDRSIRTALAECLGVDDTPV